MNKNKASLFVKELRTRIRNLSLIDDNSLFFKEVGRLGEWVQNTTDFKSRINNLTAFKKQAEGEKNQSVVNLFNECKKVWFFLKHNIPESESFYLEKLKEIDEKKEGVSVIELYNALKHTLQELAKTKFRKNISSHIRKTKNGTYKIIGKLNKLNMEFSMADYKFKERQKKSEWGALGTINMIVSWRQNGNNEYVLSKLAKIYKKDEFVILFNVIADYFFDFPFLPKVKETVPLNVKSWKY